MDLLTEKQTASESIYKGKIIDVYRDDVRLPDGSAGVREYIRHIGASCVVPVTDAGEVLMVRQFRYPFGRVLLEVPAGKLDRKDEDPLAAARRELAEETGATAESWTYMGAFYPTCAYSDEVIHMYLAAGLHFGQTSPDEDEFIETARIPLADLVKQILTGEICDGKTQTALLKAFCILKERGILS
ncbi:MAG: NUDIX hydrolase [Clostridia bacterium]|nr:NUDIX hydrolase [Clostridia bacterium]